MRNARKTLRMMAVMFAAAIGLAACTTANSGGGNDVFPKQGKPITMIIPFAPGGLTDVSARVLTPALGKELGTSIEVINQPGASSQVGMTALSQAKPDGYTFGYTLLPTTPNAYLDPQRKAAFKRENFKGFANYFSTPIVAVVNANSDLKSVNDLVTKAKANSAKLAVGTGALGGPADMARVLLENSAGISFANVQFDGGGPTAVALLGGHIEVAFSSVPEIQQYVKSGQMRALGVMAKEPVSLLPDVKTFAEQGFDLEMASVGILSVPAGTPDAIVTRLSEATKVAMQDQAVIAKAAELGFLLNYMTPQEVDAAWTKSDEQVAQILKGSGE
ncbi:tripartite tricarboxylate transporter substrate binding protein [Saccharopolyspora sp. ASAGF58]|uniref:tripartite tricarboxylate transporter substrate binding protein n=1 Tax=Saccharopolyspora sp. ASAGF58 TaxID=2719023 RepID=UPI001447B360|nr:tripartite tricarboxylate transporter substrate binding protein [Saccharopolyspora sp. ASAGF58]